MLTILCLSGPAVLAACSSSDDDGGESTPKKCASSQVNCSSACTNLAAMCQTPPPPGVCNIVCDYLEIGAGSTPMERCQNTCTQWREFTDSWHCNAQSASCDTFSKCVSDCPD